ncbi:arginyl-tRNA-protein transferase [Pseudomonas putida]|nr:arginyl-tRNA-protein transferase [Pseudomonas putida]
MTELARLKFYATQPHSCSYLPDEQATTLFLDPSQPMDVNVYADLSEMGFRRSGDHLYRPHCQRCSACVPARIPTAGFTPSRQQKRILKRNPDVQVTCATPRFTEEYFDLYQLPFSRFYEFRLEGKLVAVAVTDVLPNGLSAVYTFYEPTEERRSLGRLAILWQIEEARRLNLDAVYLGYWIKNCQKMNYKTQYRPIELLINQRWVTLN